MKQGMTELQVTEKWRELLAGGSKLLTQTGQGLEILYPGKKSDAPGSDFQDAVICIEHEVTRGNIEIHVKSSDWRAHRHHLNPTYNGIVLHVAMWQDCLYETELQNGLLVPTVIIADQPGQNTNISPVTPCSGIAAKSGEHLLKVLDSAGKERFLHKAARFLSEMESSEAGQCLYRGIMEALGYSSNKKPFLMLAEKVPLTVLESIVHSGSEDEGLLRTQAWLSGTAGFLPAGISKNSEDGSYMKALETRWGMLPHNNVMCLSDWQVYKVRPGNSPVRRLAGMSYLLRQYRATGLLDAMIKLVSTLPANNSNKQLEDGWMVRDDNSYWTNHYEFGRQCRGLSPWLIGQARAADIIVNVLLPFMFAWGKKCQRNGLAEKAFILFCDYHALESNTIERHMRRQFGLEGAQVKTARRQQGLLHLYKNWCIKGRCGGCTVIDDAARHACNYGRADFSQIDEHVTGLFASNLFP